MFSFEPFTLKEIGSPQVFQTGETFRNARLIDYQHPHDLFSELSVAIHAPGRLVDPDDDRGSRRRARPRTTTVHASSIRG